jgi:hypothetical protein
MNTLGHMSRMLAYMGGSKIKIQTKITKERSHNAAAQMYFHIGRTLQKVVECNIMPDCPSQAITPSQMDLRP